MSISGGMDKEAVGHIYKGIVLSQKKKEIVPLCSSMDKSRECHIERNKIEKEKYHMTYVESKMKGYK